MESDWQLQSSHDMKCTAIAVMTCSSISLVLMTTMITRLGRMLRKRTEILSSPLSGERRSDDNAGNTNSIDVLFMLSMAYILNAASILFMSVSATIMSPKRFHRDVCAWYGTFAYVFWSAPHVASAYVQFHAYLSARKMRCSFTKSHVLVWGMTLLQGGFLGFSGLAEDRGFDVTGGGCWVGDNGSISVMVIVSLTFLLELFLNIAVCRFVHQHGTVRGKFRVWNQLTSFVMLDMILLASLFMWRVLGTLEDFHPSTMILIESVTPAVAPAAVALLFHMNFYCNRFAKQRRKRLVDPSENFVSNTLLGVQFEVPWSEERPEDRQQLWYANASEEIKKRHIRVNRILGEAVNRCVRDTLCRSSSSSSSDEEKEFFRPCNIINAVLDSIAQDHQLNENDLLEIRNDTKRLETYCKNLVQSKRETRRRIKKRPLTGRWDPVDVGIDDGGDDGE